MAKIGGFDPNVGIVPVADGREEIGRANLPAGARVLPESQAGALSGLFVFGRLSDSSVGDRLAAWLAGELKHRELLSPDVFFEALGEAAQAFREGADEEGRPEEGPLAEAARALAEVLADRDLCETLRRLVLQA